MSRCWVCNTKLFRVIIFSATKDTKKENAASKKREKKLRMKLRCKWDEKRQKVDFRFPLYIVRAVSICRRQMDWETDLTGLVIKAEESEHQSLSAFMAEKFNLSGRRLHFTGGRQGSPIFLCSHLLSSTYSSVRPPIYHGLPHLLWLKCSNGVKLAAILQQRLPSC